LRAFFTFALSGFHAVGGRHAIAGRHAAARTGTFRHKNFFRSVENTGLIIE
jgi:hypothetical protein